VYAEVQHVLCDAVAIDNDDVLS